MVAAWNVNSTTIRPGHIVQKPNGIASAILRGYPSRAHPYVRRNLGESRGTFIAVSEPEIRHARHMVEDSENISPCFAVTAVVAGLVKLAHRGDIPDSDVILINLTGSERKEQHSESQAHYLM